MTKKPPFNIGRFFLSLKGRVSRHAFAAFELPAALAVWATSFGAGWLWRRGLGLSPTNAGVIFLLAGLLGLVLLWPRFAILVKRLHDVDWPWQIGLIFFLPLPVAAARGLAGYLDAQSGFQSHYLASPVFAWLNNGLTLATYALFLLMCCLPPRPSADRHGRDPRRPAMAAPDVF